MTYKANYQSAENLMHSIDQMLVNLNDPFLNSMMTGFLSVYAVTVYELAIKKIFSDFAQTKHKVFGAFVTNNFDRINGRISYQSIKDDYLKKFGEKYRNRFLNKIDKIEKHHLKKYKVSVLTSYANIITWRNEFAHQGRIPNTATYQEVIVSYNTGKIVIDCLYDSMKR